MNKSNYKMIRVSGDRKAINQLTSYIHIRQEDGLRVDIEEVTAEEIERLLRAQVLEYLEEKQGTGEALTAFLKALHTRDGEQELLQAVRKHRREKMLRRLEV